MRYFKFGGLVVVLMLAWLALVPGSFYFGWFSRPLAERGDTDAFLKAAKKYVTENNPPAAAFALIKNGQVYGAHYSSSTGAALGADTLFPLASMSKWFTAYGIMALSDRGQLDLDRPIDELLTRWHLPPGEFDNRKVTTRLLLRHRADIHDGLGFGDYLSTETLPSLEESLAHPRASSGQPVRIAVTSEPGSEFDYSGGSYHLLELVVEEVAKQGFEQYMEESVFKPLGMTRANYRFIGDEENSVHSYTTTGEVAPSYQYASSGATALNGSIHDIERFLQAQIAAAGIEGVVASDTIATMRQAQTSFAGVSIWGLGVMLSAKTDQGNYIYGHDGANDPAINSSAKINPDTGDAIVALANGDPDLASKLTIQWAYWQVGRPGWLNLVGEWSRIEALLLRGWAVILLLSVAMVFLRRKRKPITS